MRNNKFRIGERIRALLTEPESGDTRHWDGIVRAVKGVALLIQYDIPRDTQWINYRNCVRLVRRKKR